MGNSVGRLKLCFFSCANSSETSRRRNETATAVEDDVGHSFFYQPQESAAGDAELNVKNATFTFISGAAVSANHFTSSVTTNLHRSSSAFFQSSDSFSTVPFPPINRRHSFHSDPMPQDSGAVSVMGLVDRAFLSGPIPATLDPFDDHVSEPKSKKRTFVEDVKKTITNSFVVPMRAEKKSDGDKKDDTFMGKAGEDRIHVVVSKENEWVFVGIYDGFNGSDATDFLHNNLYTNVHKELKWLLNSGCESMNVDEVLKSLSEALRKTESCFFQVSETMLKEHPELFLMGSCVLVMIMKGQDVYVMNVGDSRAVLGRDKDVYLSAIQLTMDHNTSVEEEVKRLMEEHKDDAEVIKSGRVKGSLNLTRAFGAGFLKKPKWNNALFGPFRKVYIGSSPYLNCMPNLRHHRLCSKDKFLILSSDGLNQYFTNEEAVSEVGMFLALNPDGDPAQHLVQQVLLRAARKAGMKLNELLDIPVGDCTDVCGRRKYHDDVSIIIVSFEGTIWQSADHVDRKDLGL